MPPDPGRQLDLQGTLVEKIIQDHLGDLEKRKYPNIAKDLNVTPQEVMEASQIDHPRTGTETRQTLPFR